MMNYPKHPSEIQTRDEMKKLHSARRSHSQRYTEEQATALAKLILAKADNHDSMNQKVYLYRCPSTPSIIKHETRLVNAAVKILRSKGWLVTAEQAEQCSVADAREIDDGRVEWVVEFYSPLRWHIHRVVWTGAVVLVTINFALCQYFR